MLYSARIEVEVSNKMNKIIKSEFRYIRLPTILLNSIAQVIKTNKKHIKIFFYSNNIPNEPIHQNCKITKEVMSRQNYCLLIINPSRALWHIYTSILKI